MPDYYMEDKVVIRAPEQISIDFNKKINEFLTRLECRLIKPIEKAHIDRIKKRISLVRKNSAIGGQAILRLCGPFIFEYQAVILQSRESCEKYFMKLDVKSTHGELIKKEDEFIYDMIESIKEHYLKVKDDEKEEIYRDVCKLLNWWIEYCIVMKLDASQKWQLDV